jgi:hypothetical protein
MRRIFSLALTCLLFAGTVPGQQPVHYSSPDRKLVVTVNVVGPQKSESRVVIRSAERKVLSKADYSSTSGDQGFSVMQAVWTPDSQYFVFRLESSGGHQPYASPTFFYSRKLNRIASLDDIVGGIARDGAMTVSSPDLVEVWLYGTAAGPEKRVKVSLHTVDHR